MRSYLKWFLPAMLIPYAALAAAGNTVSDIIFRSVVAGYTVGWLAVCGSFFLLIRYRARPHAVFLKVFFGGMAVRFLVFVCALAYARASSFFDFKAVFISLGACYVVFLMLEAAYFARNPV